MFRLSVLLIAHVAVRLRSCQWQRLSVLGHAMNKVWLLQVLTNIETAQRQNRLFDALKQGNAALKSLQQV